MEGGDIKMSNVQLYPHQKQVLAETKNNNRVAYYLDRHGFRKNVYR